MDKFFISSITQREDLMLLLLVCPCQPNSSYNFKVTSAFEPTINHHNYVSSLTNHKHL